MQIVKEPRGQEKKRETVSRFWIGGESLQPDDKGRMPKRARLIVRCWGAQIHDPTLENCANFVLAKFYFRHSTSWVSVDRRPLIECAILWPQRAECSVSVLTLLTPAPSNRRGGRKQDAPVAKMTWAQPHGKGVMDGMAHSLGGNSISDCDEMWESVHEVCCVRKTEMSRQKRVNSADVCRMNDGKRCVK